jgi:hypothetical protein
VCGQIGTVLAFDKALDCAIAEIESDISYAPKVRRILRADGTTEQEGRIVGSTFPVAGDEVYKVGARTGLTRGIISDFDATEVEVTPIAPFTRMSNKGDSGSVYISLILETVCGLHHSGDGTRAFGTPFHAVADALDIDVIPSNPDIQYTVLDWLGAEAGTLAEPPFGELADRLRLTSGGRVLLDLVHSHRDEVLTLLERRRRFTVAWQRFQGPAFLAALGRSAKDPLYRVPDRISGVSRREAARAVADALRLTASPALVADLEAFGPELEALIEANTVAEMLELWEAARALAAR